MTAPPVEACSCREIERAQELAVEAHVPCEWLLVAQRGLQGGVVQESVEVRSQLRIPLAMHCIAQIVEVDEVRCDREVSDTQHFPGEEFSLDRRLEVIEDLRQRLVLDRSNGRGIGRLLQDVGPDDLLKEETLNNLAKHSAIRIFLEP